MNISRNDSRHYQAITLANGLKVLLVQDAQSTRSSAAVTINAGHFDDPWQRQGLAHFVEHMLFLGTEKYPEAGEFNQFINRHGGSANAWTGTEHTCYYFDIQAPHFADALDRFSQLFISPLFNKEHVFNERQAIDAEFKMKVKDDGRRIYQAHKETVNPNHPFAKFSVGSADTLSDEPNPAVDDLKAFFSVHYQAQWMTLVVCAPEPLAWLHEQVQTCFAQIPHSTKPKPKISEPLYLENQLATLLTIEPNKHLQKLIISFAMPNIDKFFRHKTVSFMAHLLGYEGPGSLHAILKDRGWINALSAGGGVDGSNFKDFNISLALTDEGIEFYRDIVETVFAYIALIRNEISNLAPLYRDKQTLLQIAFDNQEKTRLIDWVSNLSVSMHHYPSDHYLDGDYLMQGFEQEQFKQALSWLTPSNMRLVLIHPGVEASKTTQWYNTPYHLKPLQNAWLEALENIDMPIEEMHLPSINPYLLRPCVLHEVVNPQSQPQLIHSHPGLNFWYKQDATYRVAKGHFYLALDSHLAVRDVAHMAMTRLFADLFIDAVAEQFYPAELAGLNYHISPHQGGLTLFTAGLSSSQLELVAGLLHALFHKPLCVKRFAEYKKQLVRHWRNSNQNKPVSEIFSRIGAHIMPWSPTPHELADALANCSFSQFNKFRTAFFQALHAEAFLHGNWRSADAYDFLNLLQHHLKERAKIDTLTRPLNTIDGVDKQGLALDAQDHALVIYYQALSNELKEKVLLMCCQFFVNQPYFDSLRTQQQLGYLVGAGYAPFNGRAGVAFYVQSPTADSETILQSHNAFIDEHLKVIEQMSEEQWHTLKHGLNQHIAEKDKNLRLRSQRFWLAINSQGGKFDMQDNMLNELERITFAEFKQYNKMLFAENRSRLQWHTQ